MPPDDDNQDTTAPPSAPAGKPQFTAEQQQWLDREFAAARRQGRESADKKFTVALDEKFAALEARLAPPAAAPARTAAMAPSGNIPSEHHGSPSQLGLQDVFSLSAADIDRLGPKRLREIYEGVLSVGREQAGTPQRPTVPKRGR